MCPFSPRLFGYGVCVFVLPERVLIKSRNTAGLQCDNLLSVLSIYIFFTYFMALGIERAAFALSYTQPVLFVILRQALSKSLSCLGWA